MTGNKPELGLGYFDRLVVEKAKGKMESIGGGGERIAWWGCPPWMMIVAEAVWSLAPSFF
jgi:hypothetical protein